jgi:hypothetical protein
METSSIKIPMLVWRRLLRDLRKRGGGLRESGAFLLAKRGDNRVSRVLYYDALDEGALETGIITLHAIGFVRLWSICQNDNLKVLVDIHTHPSAWTGQSESDRTHPMIAQAGHFALILPNYAKRNRRPLGGASVYEYLGDHKWKSWPPKSGPVQITIF